MQSKHVQSNAISSQSTLPESFMPVRRVDITYLEITFALSAKVRLTLPTLSRFLYKQVGGNVGGVYLFWTRPKNPRNPSAPDSFRAVGRDFDGLMIACFAIKIAKFAHVVAGRISMFPTRGFDVEVCHGRIHPSRMNLP
jgi:hypothetical protein